jgi:hypothetical protein
MAGDINGIKNNATPAWVASIDLSEGQSSSSALRQPTRCILCALSLIINKIIAFLRIGKVRMAHLTKLTTIYGFGLMMTAYK